MSDVTDHRSPGRLVDVVVLALCDPTAKIPTVAERDSLRVGDRVELLVFGPTPDAAVRVRYTVRTVVPATESYTTRPSYSGELVVDAETPQMWVPVVPIFGPQHVWRIVR